MTFPLSEAGHRAEYDRIRGIATTQFVNYHPAGFEEASQLQAAREAKMNAIEAERQAIQWRLELALQVADDMERLLGVDGRWKPGNEEYEKVCRYIQNRKFVRAVESRFSGLALSVVYAQTNGYTHAPTRYIHPSPTHRCSLVVAYRPLTAVHSSLLAPRHLHPPSPLYRIVA